MTATPPEVEALHLAARVRPSDEQAGRLGALLRRGGLDWDLFVRRARAQGVAPLVAWRLQSVGLQPLVPPAALARLRRDLQDNAARNLLLAGELLQLVRLFEQAGIPALPFKGPTLASAAYGNLALRPFGDLDVLLYRRDARRARDLLLGRGYRPPGGWTARQEEFSLETIGQLYLERGGTVVELHTAPLPGAFSFALGMEDLWSRRQAVELLGRQVPGPCAEDLLLLLCAHGAKHLWARLMWVCDVAELVGAQPGLCWGRVLERARQLRAERMLHLGLALARRLLGSPLPPAAAAGGAAVRRLAGEVERRLRRGGEDRPAGALTTCSFYLRVRERLRDGLRYCLSMALTPTEADWSAVPGELPLTWLYYLVRPLRLAGKYTGAGQRA